MPQTQGSSFLATPGLNDLIPFGILVVRNGRGEINYLGFVFTQGGGSQTRLCPGLYSGYSYGVSDWLDATDVSGGWIFCVAHHDLPSPGGINRIMKRIAATANKQDTKKREAKANGRQRV